MIDSDSFGYEVFYGGTQNMKSESGKKRKPLRAVIAGIPVLLAGLTVFLSLKNVQNADRAFRNGMGIVDGMYQLARRETGEFREINLKGLKKCSVDQFDMPGFGNLAILRTHAGLKQKTAFVMTPYEKKMPACTVEYTYFLWMSKADMEFCDLTGKEDSDGYKQAVMQLDKICMNYYDIEEEQQASNWNDSFRALAVHKKLQKQDELRNQDMLCSVLSTYLNAAKAAATDSPEDTAQQLAAAESYSEQLLENGGGPADDIREALSRDQAQAFLSKVFFDTEAYRENMQ